MIFGLISSALCCTCQAISCTCTLMGCCFSVASPSKGGISIQMANYLNILLLGLVTAVCFIFRYYADDMKITEDNWCTNFNQGLSTFTPQSYLMVCEGNLAVYRLSTALEIYFTLGLLMSLFNITSFHRGFYFWKFLIVIGSCIGFLFIPGEMFNVKAYVWTARIFSMIYIIIQMILILNFAYDWNDKWVDNAFTEGSNEKGWLVAILACSFSLYVLSFVGIVFLYMCYDCSFGILITTITLISYLIFSCIALFREPITGVEGAILPAAIISCYIVYLAWSSLESNPDQNCKPLSVSKDVEGNGGLIAVSVLITTISMMWLGNSTSNTAKSIVSGGKANENEKNNVESDNPPKLLYEIDDSGRTGEDLRNEQVSYSQSENSNKNETALHDERVSLSLFYFVLLCTTLYMSMIITNFGWLENEEGNIGLMWVKVITQWLTIILYFWTLLAPICLKNRDFSSSSNKTERTKPMSSSTMEMTEKRNNRRHNRNNQNKNTDVSVV